MTVTEEKIALFIDTQCLGGAESIILSLCGPIRANGKSVVIYHFGNKHVSSYCATHGLSERVLQGQTYYKSIFTLPIFAAQLSRTLREDKVSLLHSHLYGPVIAGALAARFAGIPHVGTLHDVYIVEERPSRSKLLKIAAWFGTHLICVSNEMASFYAVCTGLPESRLKVIKNGVDLEQFYPPVTSRTDSNNSRMLTLIAVGRLAIIKRHDFLINALSQLPPTLKWRLLIVGDGPEAAKLKRLSHDLNLEENILFLGQRSNVADLLRDADIFTLTSDSEGMSLSVLEAVACGLPCVVTNVGNNAEFVGHETNGFLIKLGDLDGLAKAIQKLLENEVLRNQFAAHSREERGRLTSVQDRNKAYLQLYNELL